MRGCPCGNWEKIHAHYALLFALCKQYQTPLKCGCAGKLNDEDAALTAVPDAGAMVGQKIVRLVAVFLSAVLKSSSSGFALGYSRKLFVAGRQAAFHSRLSYSLLRVRRHVCCPRHWHIELPH
jgi:hypothetical protein